MASRNYSVSSAKILDNRVGVTPGTRTGRQRNPERGLPSVDALRELARTYLQTQAALWPDLVRNGTIPELFDEVLDKLASDFKRQFLDAGVKEAIHLHASLPSAKFASSYLRYSCDHSNPRSLDQQLRLQLEKARQNNHFIPWRLVFADAAVSGTTADRSGYILAKKALRIAGMETMYIDEIGRASRDAIESLRLGRLVAASGKRLIGVSDGFDSDSPVAKMMLQVFAMLQEWFVDQLRSKVNRGMNDAFDRGTNIHGLAVGYQLEPAIDKAGRPLLGGDGDRLNHRVIDPIGAKAVREAFRLFVEENKSPAQIARRFNEHEVGGQNNWEPTGVRQLLERYTYVGIDIYRRTHKVHDPETGKGKTCVRPRKEWRVRRQRHLQIITWATWKAAQKKLTKSGEAWAKRIVPNKPSRTEIYPSILIRPRCGSCGAELMLGNSSKYPSMCCLNGVHGKKNCTAKGYKSIRILESSILGHLQREVFTSEFLQQVLESANRFLLQEADRPTEDVKPLRNEIRSTQAKRDKLVTLIEADGAVDLGALVEKVRIHERRLGELRTKLRQVEVRNTPPPPPIDLADVERLLTGFRDLLQKDVAVAAPILRELTGPIIIDQVKEPDQTHPIWVATFTINAVSSLVRLVAPTKCPTTHALEYLHERRWVLNETVMVKIEETTRLEILAPRVAGLAAKGASLNAIANALSIAWETARNALRLANSGALIKSEIVTRPSASGVIPSYIRLASRVAEIRDSKHLTYDEIAKEVGVSKNTAARAYDHAHASRLVDALEQFGVRPPPPPTKEWDLRRQQIAERLRAGDEPKLLAKTFGCSVGTVYRIRSGMKTI